MIYNHLFVNIYSLALKSKANRDNPLIISLLFVFLCFMFNIQSLFILFKLKNEILEIILLTILGGLIILKYSYNKNYEKIYNAYTKINPRSKTIESIFIVLIYYLTSLTMLFLSAIFVNKDWIFK